MKLFCAFLLLLLALLLPACGASETATTSDASTPPGAEKVDQAGKYGLGKFPGHPGAPRPTKLEVEDIEPGSGPAARRGDEVKLRYIGIDYETGDVFIHRRGSDEPLDIRLGFAAISAPWEKGIVGMRVGGERRLVIPHAPELAEGPLEYLVELVALEPHHGDRGGA